MSQNCCNLLNIGVFGCFLVNIFKILEFCEICKKEFLFFLRIFVISATNRPTDQQRWMTFHMLFIYSFDYHILCWKLKIFLSKIVGWSVGRSVGFVGHSVGQRTNETKMSKKSDQQRPTENNTKPTATNNKPTTTKNIKHW